MNVASEPLARALRRAPGAQFAARSRRVRSIAARFGIEPLNPRPNAPAQPVGAKLELTYACNLRCGFCYTDSPRRTLERAFELSDNEWLQIADELIELGAIEAVVTGGEPLLRRELALEMIARLDAAGIGVTFNTNGWFVDETVADRLAATRSTLNVHVSLDGATPELHDAARGVPGSWRRAIGAIGLLVERGISTHMVQVVTPRNEHAVGEMIEQAWLIGASSIRLTPVIAVGAAARTGGWSINESRLRRNVDRARRRIGPELDIVVVSSAQRSGPVLAPAYLLVRPNGAVMAGTLSPFRFGDARADGLAASWQRIVADWDHPHARAWREPVLRGKPLEELSTVIYRDDELDIDEPPPTGPPELGQVRLPRPAPAATDPGIGSFDAARRHVLELALAHRYRLGAVRWSEAGSGTRYVRVTNGNVARLNATAAIVMDACADGTPSDAIPRIAAGHAGAPPPDLDRDVVGAVRQLIARGIVTPAATPARQ